MDTDLVCGTVGNAARVAALHVHWRHAHPEAGPLYWSARSWSQLVWQPVYLTVLGVHLVGLMPRLARVGQSVRDGAVCGFSLPGQGARSVSSVDPIGSAARQLRAYLARQWREAMPVFPLHAKVADRLAADFLMAALLLVQRQTAMSNESLHELARQWLAAMGMSGCSSLINVQLDDGRNCLALGRKICCQHFRRADATLCSGCPKLNPQLRMALLRQELAAEC
jgi:siderophore ferric iron reductase